MPTKRLVISQPYVPAYRREFFTLLTSELADHDIELTIFASGVRGAAAARGDAVALPNLISGTSKQLRFAGRSISYAPVPGLWRGADGVILPLKGSSLEVYSAIARRLSSRTKLGLWGHVLSYVNDPHPIDMAAETLQMRSSHHVFAYTESGRRDAIRRGVPESRVTAVMNTVQTAPVVDEIARLTPEQVRRFAADRGITGKAFAYVGGLDASKRIDLLADILDELWLRDPSIKVLVGGAGEASALLAPSVAREQTIMMGRVGPKEKALIAGTSSALLCPGRVGLVAVDALAMRLPLVTMQSRYHAPELEYLTVGHNLTLVDGDVKHFADEALRVAGKRADDRIPPAPPAMSAMVANFRAGVLQMFGAS